MIFAVDHLVWYLSQFMVLRPGRRHQHRHAGRRRARVGRTQPYLRAGDVVELEIDGLGPAAPDLRGRPDMGELDGLRALVTGGASGIGLAIATALRRRDGAAVAVARPGTADRRTPLPADVAYVTADVTDDAAVRARGRRGASSALGGLDILVNNAGIGAQGTVDGRHGRGVAPRARRQRRRHRAGLPRRAGRTCAASAHAADRQHLLDRRDRRPAAAGGVLAPARARCSR